jgi:hypothetical protein
VALASLGLATLAGYGWRRRRQQAVGGRRTATAGTLATLDEPLKAAANAVCGDGYAGKGGFLIAPERWEN